MTTRSLVLATSLLLPLGLAPFACTIDDDTVTAAADHQDFRGGDANTLRSDLELLRDGIRGVASDPDLRALAHESILAAAEEGEYEVLLSDFATTVAELDISLADHIKAGVTAHGGSDEDATRAVMLIDALEIDGTAAAPTLYVPHLDGSYFGFEPWESPVLFSTAASFDGEELVGVELNGPELLISEDMINTTSAWFVSYRVTEGEDPSPLRPFARCYCVQTNPSGGTVGVTCSTGGSATTLGTCGRTGLFGGNCSGSCGDAQG